MIYNHIREVADNLSDDDKALISAMKAAAVAYCVGYTGLSETDLDTHDDITIAVLSLISDMWDNRSTTVDRANENRVVSTILGMYCVNLIPEEAETWTQEHSEA